MRFEQEDTPQRMRHILSSYKGDLISLVEAKKLFRKRKKKKLIERNMVISTNKTKC